MPCRPAISSMSLGRAYAGHSIDHKLTMAAKHNLAGIELFYEDLATHASTQSSTPQGQQPSKAALLSAARYIRSLCTSLGLTIICLQPFMHYEGLVDRSRHRERIEEMKLWFEIAKVLGTDVIQVPSSFLPATQCSGDVDLIVRDLVEIADMGATQTPVMRFAYESLSWGTHVDVWEKCWEIVKKVDRTNFGICLDSFNILGRIYADPSREGGCAVDCERVVEESVERLVREIGPHREKIFFIQIVDAERLERPLVEGHAFYNAEQPCRMSWSRNCRLFYGETSRGAYLPVRKVADAIINRIGYEGWVSMELFNRVMERKDFEVVEELASRAAEGWRKMVVDLDMDVEVPKPISRKDSANEKAFEQIARL